MFDLRNHHDDFRANTDTITGMIGREGRVASMLKSKAMHEVFAI